MKGEGTDPTLGFQCAALFEAVVVAEGPVAVVRRTPQKPATALSRLSYVGLRECPELRPPDSLGPHAVGSQSEFHWD